VSDTGTGVELKTEKQLFEPFFTTKPHGLGLGLSISRSIVEAHDGSLSFSSNLDRGATFCIRLPVASNINAKHSTGGPIDAE
jgi:two-component system, LuxR family, sensor kinase FixL